MEWLIDWQIVATRGEMVLRLFVAVLLGGVVGWEREAQNKPAGMRTHMMVSLGAASFTLATLQIFTMAGGLEHARSDPIRVIEGVVGGIGFLGAGTIIQARGSVKGITTAASIWVTGAIGIACGAGQYPLAGMTALLVVIILTAVGFLEQRLLRTKGADPGDL